MSNREAGDAATKDPSSSPEKLGTLPPGAKSCIEVFPGQPVAGSKLVPSLHVLSPFLTVAVPSPVEGLAGDALKTQAASLRHQ